MKAIFHLTAWTQQCSHFLFQASKQSMWCSMGISSAQGSDVGDENCMWMVSVRPGVEEYDLPCSSGGHWDPQGQSGWTKRSLLPSWLLRESSGGRTGPQLGSFLKAKAYSSIHWVPHVWCWLESELQIAGALIHLAESVCLNGWLWMNAKRQTKLPLPGPLQIPSHHLQMETSSVQYTALPNMTNTEINLNLWVSAKKSQGLWIAGRVWWS